MGEAPWKLLASMLRIAEGKDLSASKLMPRFWVEKVVKRAEYDSQEVKFRNMLATNTND
jgi:hypothetical protein